LRLNLDGFLRARAITPPPLLGLFPLLASWPPVVFILNFAVLDLADYWRHRISHRVGWWYGIHSLHHAEEQMTFWSDAANQSFAPSSSIRGLNAHGTDERMGTPRIRREA
jgi:sterol desaturase/sphingolipid hydroxylase (fatty acid hydroxylase superfamily)